MGLFGVPLSGSPICGTYNSSLVIDNLSEVKEEQLCIRWYQMGMMLPFAHSMTKLNQRARSPVDWSLNTRRLVAGYIQQRYRLLPYFYSLFYQVKYKSHSHVGIICLILLFFLFYRPTPKEHQLCGRCGTNSQRTMKRTR